MLSNMISSHVRISYRFYLFVTTRYTTDFYIIKCSTYRFRYETKLPQFCHPLVVEKRSASSHEVICSQKFLNDGDTVQRVIFTLWDK